MKKQEASKKAYAHDPDKFKKSSNKNYAQNSEKRKQDFKSYYVEHREEICSMKRDKYVLAHPNEGLIKSFVEGLLSILFGSTDIKLGLTMKLNKLFKAYAATLTNKMKSKVACQLALKNLVNEILAIRKLHAGKFLKHVRDVNWLCITKKSDFGEPSHSKHSEPFFYETAYKHAFHPNKFVIDREKRCFAVAGMTPEVNEYINDKPIPLDMNGKAHISDNNECSYLCRSVSDHDVKIILDIKKGFE